MATLCCLLLPHALPAGAETDALTVDGMAGVPAVPAPLAVRLFQGGADAAVRQAEKTLSTSAHWLILAPLGRVDDDAWPPVLDRLLRERGDNTRLTLAWTGIEPFLAAYGEGAATLARHADLPQKLLPAIQRSCRGLSELLRDCGATQRLAHQLTLEGGSLSIRLQ